MTEFINNISYESNVVIASGATASSAADLTGYALVGIIMPSAFTGSTLTLSMSDDASTFYNVYNGAGTQVSITVAASRAILFNPGDFVGLRHIKLTSGSSEGGSRTIKLITRKLT